MAHDDFSASDLIGSVIDERFEIIEKLGEGGMGAIYKARQISVDRVVALKILLHDQRGDPISVERFRHEAYLASRLKHPNAIIVHDFGQTDDGLLYIAMEYLAGETLKARLAGAGPMKPELGVKVMTEALRTIAEAHRMGLIHRDLKPDNIFLTRVEDDEAYVKVLDFGIAKLTAVQDGIEGYQGGLTMQGKIYGTPNYMSPEQIRGKTVDHQSDLYSLGIIFYEVLTGRLPFSAETPVDVMMMHLRDPPPSLVDRGIDPGLDRVVMRALEKDRRVRYQSAEELLEAIESYKFNSGFYAVPARLAAMASMTDPGKRPEELDDDLDDDDDEDEGLGETLMLQDGAGIVSPFAQEDIFASDSLGNAAVDDDDDDATMMGINVQLDADEKTMLEDPDALELPEDEKTVFEPEHPLDDDSLSGMDPFGVADDDIGFVDAEMEDSVLASPASRPLPSPPRRSASGARAPSPTPPPEKAFPSKLLRSPQRPEEPTMLELDDDEFEEVEPSRLVPIPEFDDSGPLRAPSAGQKRTLFGPPAPARPSAPPSGGPPRASAPPAPTRPTMSGQPRPPMPAPRPSVRPAPAARPVAPAPMPAAPAPMPAMPVAARATQPPPQQQFVGGGRSGGNTRLIVMVLAGLLAVGAGAAAVIVLDPFGGGGEEGGGEVAVGPPKMTFAASAPLEIFEDGRFVGETPIEYTPQGETCCALQFATAKRTFRASVNSPAPQAWWYVVVPEASVKSLGYVVVQTDPAGAAVKVGGQPAGQTPLVLMGKPGETVGVEVTGETGAGRADAKLGAEGGELKVGLE